MIGMEKMSEVISLNLYFTDYVSKKDRRLQYPNDFNETILDNATFLLKQINGFLNELGIKSADVTSGWRPPEINGQTTNAAKKSAHMSGSACDILDNKTQDLAHLVATRPDLLKKYGLWLENPQNTKGQFQNWVHLDVLNRSDRPSRMFNP